MPLFVAGLLNALAALYTFFKESGIKRYALVATAATVVIGAFAVLKGVLSAGISGIAMAMPDIAAIGLSWVCPTNLDDCVAIRITCEVAFAFYRWQHNIVLQSAINAQ